jgi:hypothetical protein
MAGHNKCFRCGKKMVTRKVRHKGIDLFVEKCLGCGETYFSEKQFDEAFIKIQQGRMKEDYIKKPMRIGNSIGITFPKEVVDAFQLDKKRVRLKPNIRSGVIQITVET